MLTGAIIALCGVTSCSDDNVASIDPVSTQAEENTPISFGTYVGGNKSTRAGQTGNLNTANLTTAGFGVFAYNTGTKDFKSACSKAEEGNLPLQPDYMFNTKVTGTVTDGKYTWTPELVKYWPNPTTDPTTLSPVPQYVTFLAYAPYAELNDGTIANEKTGITGFGYHGTVDDAYKGITATYRSDPFIYYSRTPKAVTQSDGTTAYESVDLLWGTAEGHGNGAAADITDEVNIAKPNNRGGTFSPGTFSVNSDLTKMKTDGKVQFQFKHALGAFGGDVRNSDGSSNGILIDYYLDSKSSEGNKTKGDAVDDGTKIYVNWIAVEFMSGMKDKSDGTKYMDLKQTGQLDLLTGQWFNSDPSDPSNQSYPADQRPRDIYFFSPNNSTPGTIGLDADYRKYLNKYSENGTSDENIRVYTKKLSNKLYFGTATNPNKYDNSFLTTDYRDWAHAPVGVSYLAQSIYENQSAPIFFIPGTRLSVKVVVNYDIVTADPNINSDDDNANHLTVTHQEMARQVDFNSDIAMNRYYSLYIHLGLTSMKLEAFVDSYGTDVSDTDTKSHGAIDTKVVEISPNEKP